MSAATEHGIDVHTERSNQSGRERIKLQIVVRGSRGAAHAILLSSSWMLESDPRRRTIEAACLKIAAELVPMADQLCVCPAPAVDA